MNRRQVLITASLLPLAACAGTSVATLAAQAAQDIQTISGGLPAIFSALKVGGLTGNQLGQVTADITKAQTAAATLSMMPAIPVDAPPLQEFEAGVNDVLSIAAAVIPGNPYVLAASLLVPLIETGVNMVASQVAPGAAAMTPDEARALLLRSAAR